MTNTATTEVDAEAATVTITRDYDAPRHLVYAAMLDPEQLAQFWGPVGTHSPADRMVVEPRVGGRFETVMVADDGSGEYPTKAVYTEIDEPNVIAFREPDEEMLNRVTIVQTNVPEMYRSDEALAGFLTSLDRFETYLAVLTG